MVSKPFADRHSLPYVQRSVTDVVQHIYAANSWIVFWIVWVELDKFANTYMHGTLRIATGI